MIRPATNADLPRLLQIYDCARAYMRSTGNPTQWAGGYPKEETLREDIAAGQLYVLEEDTVRACFVMAPGPDPTYGVILEGAWASDTPYGVLHRVASDGTLRRVVAQCVAFAAKHYRHLRIDTHKDNLPMQRAITREGFTCRGIIYAHDGTPRMAYDRL